MLAYEEVQINWYITPELPILSPLTHVKLPKSSLGLPIDWDYFSHQDLGSLSRYSLSPTCIEELKARLRHKQKIKGNIKDLYFTWMGIVFPFTIELFEIGNSCYLHVKSIKLRHNVNTKQLISLTHYPKVKESEIYDIIQKLIMVLQTGNIQARPQNDFEFDIFPLIHIKPQQEDTESMLNIVLSKSSLTSLGTRHPDLPRSSTIITDYFNKNLCIREQVSIVDKQSMLVVSKKLGIENIGIYHCCLIALHLQSKLRGYLNQQEHYSIIILEYLSALLEDSILRPSVMTNSVTIQKRWGPILKEFRVHELIQGLKLKIEAQRNLTIQNSNQILDELCTYADQIPKFSHQFQDFYDLNHWEANLNNTRKSLENLISLMMRHVVYKGKRNTSSQSKKTKQDETLDAHIRLLAKRETWLESFSEIYLPDDIAEILLFLKGMGNIGSHSGKEVFMTPQRTVTLVVELLHRVMKWFVECFLDHAFKSCPNCSHLSESFFYVCAKCHYEFEKPLYQSCHCDFIYPKTTTLCLICKEPFVESSDPKATTRVIWEQ